jgi:hypothetical protein
LTTIDGPRKSHTGGKVDPGPVREARTRGARIVVAALATLAVLQGCAHSWVDADGTRHVVGLVNLSLPPQSAALTAGESIRSQAIGLSFSASEAGSALVLGYSDTTFAFVRNHSLVFADALLRPGAARYCPKE